MARSLRRRARWLETIRDCGCVPRANWIGVIGLLFVVPVVVTAQSHADFVPVTDAALHDPAAADWPMWRRTLNGWGYSPLEQIDRENVDELRMVWSRALAPGSQQGTPLVYDGVMYMPNPRDIIQSLDAATGDLIWEYRRSRPADLENFIPTAIAEQNRNLSIYRNLIIDTSTDGYVFAVDAMSGRVVWETQILDYTRQPAHQTSGPIIANGKVISGRGCLPRGGPDACVVTAHDAGHRGRTMAQANHSRAGRAGGRDMGWCSL